MDSCGHEHGSAAGPVTRAARAALPQPAWLPPAAACLPLPGLPLCLGSKGGVRGPACTQ